VIAMDYPLLRDDLLTLTPDRSIPLILIKAIVCRILEPLLSKDGFRVLNDGRAIYFRTMVSRQILEISLVPS
jgi:hypothetical protein